MLSLGNAVLLACSGSHLTVTIDSDRQTFWQDEQLNATLHNCDTTTITRSDDEALVLHNNFTECTGEVQNETYYSLQRYLLVLDVSNATDALDTERYHYHLDCRLNKMSGSVDSMVSMPDAPIVEWIAEALTRDEKIIISVVVPLLFLLLLFILVCCVCLRRKKKRKVYRPRVGDGDDVSTASWTVVTTRRSIYNPRGLPGRVATRRSIYKPWVPPVDE